MLLLSSFASFLATQQKFRVWSESLFLHSFWDRPLSSVARPRFCLRVLGHSWAEMNQWKEETADTVRNNPGQRQGDHIGAHSSTYVLLKFFVHFFGCKYQEWKGPVRLYIPSLQQHPFPNNAQLKSNIYTLTYRPFGTSFSLHGRFPSSFPPRRHLFPSLRPFLLWNSFSSCLVHRVL